MVINVQVIKTELNFMVYWVSCSEHSPFLTTEKTLRALSIF